MGLQGPEGERHRGRARSGTAATDQGPGEAAKSADGASAPEPGTESRFRNLGRLNAHPETHITRMSSLDSEGAQTGRGQWEMETGGGGGHLSASCPRLLMAPELGMAVHTLQKGGWRRS